MSSEFENQFERELLNVIRSIAEAHHLMAEALSYMPRRKSKSRELTRKEEQAALAVVAVAKGASSFAEIARQLNIHPSTAQRNPGIRRALRAAVRDRRGNKDETDDFLWSA